MIISPHVAKAMRGLRRRNYFIEKKNKRSPKKSPLTGDNVNYIKSDKGCKLGNDYGVSVSNIFTMRPISLVIAGSTQAPSSMPSAY